MTQDLMLFQHPSLPDIWDYKESVEKMKRLIYKWRNLTRDVANELWTARENLKQKGGKPFHESYSSKNGQVRTWSNYCEEIGVNLNKADYMDRK